MIKNIGLACLVIMMAILLPSMSDAQNKWKKNRNSKYKIYTKNKVKPKVAKKRRKYSQRTRKPLKRNYQLKRKTKPAGAIKNRKKNKENKQLKATTKVIRKPKHKTGKIKCNNLCQYHKARYLWLINVSNDYNFDANKIK